MIYVDTSALLKLVKDDEVEGPALRAYLRSAPEPQMVSSKLLAVEARRGVLRKNLRALPRTDVLLADVVLLDISDAVVEDASRLPDPMLRSLDALHLATALLIREDIEVLLSYDDRLLDAARAHGLDAVAPA